MLGDVVRRLWNLAIYPLTTVTMAMLFLSLLLWEISLYLHTTFLVVFVGVLLIPLSDLLPWWSVRIFEIEWEDVPGYITFWHVSPDDGLAFTNGVDMNRTKTTFLGRGFYVWKDRHSSQVMATIKPARTVVAILVPAEDWARMRKKEIRFKWTWQYAKAVYLFSLAWVPWVKTWRLRKVEEMMGECDVVIAPALGMPLWVRQVLFCPTAASKEILARVDVRMLRVQRRSPWRIGAVRE